MRTKALGLSPIAILALAALGVPRVIAHDLSLVGPTVNALLVFLPIALWLAVVLWKRVPNSFLTLLAIGTTYGVLLGLTHQVLWSQSFGDTPPTLGGNLAGTLSPATEAVLLRTFAFGSSLLTGVGVGAATGAVCWLLSRLIPAPRR
ncbi:hypothetical protein LDL08_29540 [Nonomuraea glycinis]|uniref:Uncharacterized protein n=1 Tax=Nonomuraea glycinis TaxID=2047744 RepID=A0A918A311_9ACTN|nr:hypothetical protein [Nonomuraea glycinis]MCA2180331.1 hypothetical protein [Nonomuraea glycinis]GGP04008.1 hypothetical protein GCM10012278_17590 [Nonomuraea glycinis]